MSASKIKIKLLFIPKFEAGDLEGGKIGEARFFYDEYCAGSKKYILKNGYALYVNEEKGTAMGLPHAGKANAYMFSTAVMMDDRFDFSEAYIMGIGCAGAAYGNATMGDVVIISDAVDFDQGYQTVATDAEGDVEFKWYENPDTVNNAHRRLEEGLVKWAFDKTKNLTLETTETALKTMKRNFPGQEWAARRPKVLMGTALSGDSYWKGEAEHRKACMLAEHYGCLQPYRITEMEDAYCAVAMDSFGMLPRLIILRAVVNMDILLDNATPESTWSNAAKYEDSVQRENEENLDIFVPAMRNLFKVGKVLADEILAGKI